MAGCDRCGTSSPFGHCLMERLPQAQLVLLPRTLLPWALLALLALLPWTLLPQALLAQLALLPRALLALLPDTAAPGTAGNAGTAGTAALGTAGAAGTAGTAAPHPCRAWTVVLLSVGEKDNLASQHAQGMGVFLTLLKEVSPTSRCLPTAEPALTILACAQLLLTIFLLTLPNASPSIQLEM